VLPGTDIAAAITAQGVPPGPANIKSISFRSGYWYTGYGSTSIYTNTALRFKNTTFTGYPPIVYWTSAELNGETIVFTPKTYTFNSTASGLYQKFNLDLPFTWDGSSNLQVDACYEMATFNQMYTYWDAYYPSNYYFSSVFSLFDPNPQCGVNTGPNGGTWWHGNGVVPHVQMEICNGAKSTASITAPSYVTLPDLITVGYNISRASGIGNYTAVLTVRFYTPLGVLVNTQNFNIVVVNGAASGSVLVSTAPLTPGFYKMEASFGIMNECNEMAPYVVAKAIMALLPGQVPCEVWPGDANNNGSVGYDDRKALNDYIHNANLRSTWLMGPARYRTDAATNAMTYYTWEGQPSVPWQTPDGCYMDCDGNGNINGLDYIAIKINWLRSHGTSPKSHDEFTPWTFDMSQNYPNPFNPTTSIRYSAPEASQVSLTVTDMLGRTVATLVNGTVETGVHDVTFDAANLNSGNYVATINMVGVESGLTFTKTIKMVLSK
jgi:hypothetical protein